MSLASTIKRCMAGDEKKQIVMLGLDGAGKTTLLYRLKIPGWKRDEILKDMQRINHLSKEDIDSDPSYHYEEFKWVDWSYAVWDVPGSETMRSQWRVFYRYIKVTALIFVVSGAEIQDDKKTEQRIQEARQWIHYLLAEDELRACYFAVIINDQQLDWRKKPLTPYDQTLDPLHHLLGLDEIEAEEHNRKRFKKYIFDVSQVEGERSSAWSHIISDINKHMISFGGVG